MQNFPNNITHDSIGYTYDIRIYDKKITDSRYIQKCGSTTCVNTHHGVTTFQVDNCLKYKKLNISRKKVAFTWNEKFFKLCIQDGIIRSYHFLVDVTINNKQIYNFKKWSDNAKTRNNC